MRRVSFITGFILLFFLIEYLLFGANFFFRPHFLILFIIFLNFVFGIRYGLLGAFEAGLLKDSLSLGPFGLNMFALVICAYSAVFLSKYLYVKGSLSAKLTLVFSVVTIYEIILWLFLALPSNITIQEVVYHIFVPEMLSTLIMVSFVFQRLKQCVLKLSIY